MFCFLFYLLRSYHFAEVQYKEQWYGNYMNCISYTVNMQSMAQCLVITFIAISYMVTVLAQLNYHQRTQQKPMECSYFPQLVIAKAGLTCMKTVFSYSNLWTTES